MYYSKLFYVGDLVVARSTRPLFFFLSPSLLSFLPPFLPPPNLPPSPPLSSLIPFPLSKDSKMLGLEELLKTTLVQPFHSKDEFWEGDLPEEHSIGGQ